MKEFIHRLVEGEDEAGIDKDLHALGEDPRTALVLEPLRWLLKAIETEGRDPYKVIVLEQVPAVLPLWEVYAKLLRGGEGRLKGVKYEAECWELKTEQFGVPQTRTRAVLVARLPGHGAIEPLEATHLPFDLHRGKRNAAQADMFPTDSALPGTKQRWLSMAEALDAASKLKASPVDVSRLRTGGKMNFFVVSNYGSGAIRRTEVGVCPPSRPSRSPERFLGTRCTRALRSTRRRSPTASPSPSPESYRPSRTTSPGRETTRRSRWAMRYHPGSACTYSAGHFAGTPPLRTS